MSESTAEVEKGGKQELRILHSKRVASSNSSLKIVYSHQKYIPLYLQIILRSSHWSRDPSFSRASDLYLCSMSPILSCHCFS